MRTYKKKPKIISAKQYTYISTYVTTIWYKNINLPFFKRSKYVKYVKNPIGFAHKNLTRVFFHTKARKSGLFVTISLACCWRKNGSFVIWSELHFFFLSRFGDNSVTIDGDLKQKLVRFDKIFFSIFLWKYNIGVRGWLHAFPVWSENSWKFSIRVSGKHLVSNLWKYDF